MLSRSFYGDVRVSGAIMWKLRTDAPWRDLPERHRRWKTAHKRLWLWTKDDTWQKALDPAGHDRPRLAARACRPAHPRAGTDAFRPVLRRPPPPLSARHHPTRPAATARSSPPATHHLGAPDHTIHTETSLYCQRPVAIPRGWPPCALPSVIASRLRRWGIGSGLDVVSDLHQIPRSNVGRLAVMPQVCPNALLERVDHGRQTLPLHGCQRSPQTPGSRRSRPLDLATHHRLHPTTTRPRPDAPGRNPYRDTRLPQPGSGESLATSARTPPVPPVTRDPPDPTSRPHTVSRS